MNASIIGAGNIGIYLITTLDKKFNQIRLYTKKSFETNTFVGENKEKNIKTISKEIIVTDNLKEICDTSNYIFVTYPLFLREKFIEDLSKYLKKDTKVVFIPNGVGTEILSSKLTSKEAIWIGLQRVPAICRLKNQNTVEILSEKQDLFIKSIPDNKTIINDLKNIFDKEIKYLNNFAEISFTASNPILHTSRLYNLFKDYKINTKFNENIKFYKSWDDESSRYLINCDKEMRKIVKYLTNNKANITSITDHYEVKNIKEMTKKIKSIKSFENIYAPLKQHLSDKELYYTIDTDSRYFIEDFLYGLCTIKGYALLCKVETPWIDKIIFWYQSLVNKEYFSDINKIGKDYKETGMPQSCGIKDIKEINELYNN